MNSWILAAYCGVPILAGVFLYHSEFYQTLTCVN
jgi:hypothetical protein